MTLEQWAIKWGIPHAALHDYRTCFGFDGGAAIRADDATTETGATQRIRLEATRTNVLLWRNNVGATLDENGRMIRYGLCNDSAAMNKKIKSSDLIGVRPVLISEHHIGLTLGQFVCREVKKPGWIYTGTEREQAQKKFIELVLARGGDAGFATGPGTL